MAEEALPTEVDDENQALVKIDGGDQALIKVGEGSAGTTNKRKLHETDFDSKLVIFKVYNNVVLNIYHMDQEAFDHAVPKFGDLFDLHEEDDDFPKYIIREGDHSTFEFLFQWVTSGEVKPTEGIWELFDLFDFAGKIELHALHNYIIDYTIDIFLAGNEFTDGDGVEEYLWKLDLTEDLGSLVLDFFLHDKSIAQVQEYVFSWVWQAPETPERFFEGVALALVRKMKNDRPLYETLPGGYHVY